MGAQHSNDSFDEGDESADPGTSVFGCGPVGWNRCAPACSGLCDTICDTRGRDVDPEAESKEILSDQRRGFQSQRPEAHVGLNSVQRRAMLRLGRENNHAQSLRQTALTRESSPQGITPRNHDEAPTNMAQLMQRRKDQKLIDYDLMRGAYEIPEIPEGDAAVASPRRSRSPTPRTSNGRDRLSPDRNRKHSRPAWVSLTCRLKSSRFRMFIVTIRLVTALTKCMIYFRYPKRLLANTSSQR